MVLARHGVAATFIVIIILLLLINFFSHYVPVFRHDYGAFKRREVQINKQLLFSEIQNNNIQIKDVMTTSPQVTNVNQINSSKCEVVHIGLVCAGYKSNLYLHTMLKSIYFFRNNPIHFHIVVNKFSENVLKILFETWAVPQTTVSFYDINNFIPSVRWVSNSHYSGIFGLIKLTFAKVIPANATDKIIVIDTDLTFVGDVFELWKLFNNFKSNQVIGLVENQSDYYLGKISPLPWPALGRGYNTGVMLYHLERLRKIKWDKIWVDVAKKTTSVFGATRLADQDIINTVIKQNPEFLYHVPCHWNTQMSDHTHSYNCYKNNFVKIVHWNSPRKTNVVNQDGDYFRTIHTTFLEYNGYLLRRLLYDCTNDVKNATEAPVDVCSSFRKAQSNSWRTIVFFKEFKYTPGKDDVTFLAQLSYDRLHMVEKLAKHWEGPISLTFYVTDPELQQCINFIDNSEDLPDRLNIAYHVVFKDGDHYPINVLRNVGLKYVNTPYVFLADIDFLPMVNLYTSLKGYISSLKNLSGKALIVPAFESQRYRSKFPKNKRQLLEMLDNNSIFTFRYDAWAVGHAPTNYAKWKTAVEPYRVKWQPDFEPYVVVKRDVTMYDPRFLGFGWNKVSHIMELEAQSYEFFVLPNAFIIHMPHTASGDIGKFRSSPIYRMCLNNLKEDFVELISKKYGKILNSRNGTFVLAPV